MTRIQNCHSSFQPSEYTEKNIIFTELYQGRITHENENETHHTPTTRKMKHTVSGRLNSIPQLKKTKKGQVQHPPNILLPIFLLFFNLLTFPSPEKVIFKIPDLFTSTVYYPGSLLVESKAVEKRALQVRRRAGRVAPERHRHAEGCPRHSGVTLRGRRTLP